MTVRRDGSNSLPDIVKWRRQVLFFGSKGLIDSDMVVRCNLLAEGATSGTMALKGKGFTSHWTEDQIARVWGVTPKTARSYLHRLQKLGLLGCWRGNRRLPAERWLLLPERDCTPANWPWGSFASLSNAPSPARSRSTTTGLSPAASRSTTTGLSPVIGQSESGNFDPPKLPESGSAEIGRDPTFRSDVSVASPNGSMHGVTEMFAVSSVAKGRQMHREGVPGKPGEKRSLGKKGRSRR